MNTQIPFAVVVGSFLGLYCVCAQPTFAVPSLHADAERIFLEMGATITRKRGKLIAHFPDDRVTVLINSTGEMITTDKDGTIYGVDKDGRPYIKMDRKMTIMAGAERRTR